MRTFKINNATTRVGKSFIVKIKLQSEGDENGAGFSIKWNPDFLTFESVEDVHSGKGMAYEANLNNLTKGELGLAFNWDVPFTKSRAYIDLFYLKFKAVITGVTAMQFAATPTPQSVSENQRYSLVDAKYVNGRVRVYQDVG